MAWSLVGIRAFSLSLDVADGGKPVGKVVALLETMSKKLEDDQKADEDMKEKMDCWCKTNQDDKAASASAAQDKLTGLKATVEELPPKIDMLSTQIRTSTQDLNSNKATVDKANAIRAQQRTNFEEDNASLTESLAAVGGAITALNSSASSEMQSTYSSLVQTSDSIVGLAAGVSKALQRRGSLALSKMSKGDRMLLEDFLKDPSRFVRGNAFLQRAEPSGSSSQIVGIMQAIADDFAEDLQKEQAEEATNQKSYESLMAAKATESKVLEEQILAKTEEKAESETSLEAAKKDIKATTDSLGEDVKLKETVAKRCAGSDEKYQERIKTRAAEMEAVSKTLQVLRTDETRDLLGKTVSFLQEESTHSTAGRAAAAAQYLVQQGRKLGLQVLITLGLQSKLDSFTKVQEAIDSMVDALKKQKADEIAHHEMCVADLEKNNATAEEKEAIKVRTGDEIQILKTKIAESEKDAETLKSDIAEMEKQIQLAGDARQKENTKFQEEASDQKETQTVLEKAVQYLRTFYSAGSLVQIKAHTTQAQSKSDVPEAPEDFQDYQKNSNGGSAISLIETIIADARRLEAEAVEGEQDAQASYEDFVTQTGASIKAKTTEKDGKMMEIAAAKNDQAEAESAIESTEEELARLADTKASLKEECDFYMKNFEVRQKALSDEMGALSQAKGILAGA